MNKKIDMDAVKYHIRGLLEAIGEDPDREGLKETPDRVARMYQEVFEGIQYTNHEIAQMFDKTFEEDLEFLPGGQDMVIVKDIDIFSYCEHHLALMYNMKVHVGYIPNGKVIGLSKIARIADMASKRLQLQERIGTDIAEILHDISYFTAYPEENQGFFLSLLVWVKYIKRCNTKEPLNKSSAAEPKSSAASSCRFDQSVPNSWLNGRKERNCFIKD